MSTRLLTANVCVRSFNNVGGGTGESRADMEATTIHRDSFGLTNCFNTLIRSPNASSAIASADSDSYSRCSIGGKSNTLFSRYSGFGDGRRQTADGSRNSVMSSAIFSASSAFGVMMTIDPLPCWKSAAAARAQEPPAMPSIEIGFPLQRAVAVSENNAS